MLMLGLVCTNTTVKFIGLLVYLVIASTTNPKVRIGLEKSA